MLVGVERPTESAATAGAPVLIVNPPKMLDEVGRETVCFDSTDPTPTVKGVEAAELVGCTTGEGCTCCVLGTDES